MGARKTASWPAVFSRTRSPFATPDQGRRPGLSRAVPCNPVGFLQPQDHTRSRSEHMELNRC
ncbi:hypothetical protein CSC82_11320 [Rhodobacteraceae bacterium 4F10]|nr:hypothetical protein CSC82_11320 [Rhodobacteraceae bacterium 4F10]